ncbi:MAG: Fatty acid desaturase [uncultured Paraburkholderia sp.]|uniref:fatty acid desaturase family protein n=1 Tax=uncultured Paraburkholderia sp. TaxID=1822466 RepID=UPI00259A2B33|nr:fatty acid desaturase [uncultured Paraburkholderia sp.]CAH2902179.1 MAG: Fatty acid desaturase [uncultured Paraburkholderia sp.]CAH2936374.1 MAG: Fatty acid desaturase [uncultured Paraburkholderia sp.]
MTNRAVIHDQDLIRSAFSEWNAVHEAMTAPNVLRVFADIVFDWLSIAGAMLILHRFGWFCAPAAVAWIGNRQRALGNLLHDAAHRNLVTSRQLNDALARLFIAPALFNSLSVYREAHARHHAWLGDAHADPDYIDVQPARGNNWWRPYFAVLLTTRTWTASVFGHLPSRQTTISKKVAILVWWIVVLGALTSLAGLHLAILFFALWIMARGTVFHAITVFREFCDHFGRQPGGIFSYTRDVSSTSVWHWVIHPRNNGYHLTHHLMPSVPYHRLPQAQKRLLELPCFDRTVRVCHAYFYGPDAVVREWELRLGQQA